MANSSIVNTPLWLKSTYFIRAGAAPETSESWTLKVVLVAAMGLVKLKNSKGRG